MPELPEVETIRRSIVPSLEGRRVVAAEVRGLRTVRRNQRPADVVERLVGRRVRSVGRRGKFLVLELEGDMTWVMHLGMSGRIRIVGADSELEPHTHFLVRLDDGSELRFVDPRTFGFVAVLTPEEVAASTLPGLGRDALDDLPTVDELAGLLAGRTAPVKSLLLDQRLVAGLGNIYADEALHLAGIHPARPAGRLDMSELERLREAIVVVLAQGLLHQGTSLEDLAYVLPDGRAGGNLDRLSAYGRTGRPCPRCGTPIERTVVAQRSSHLCPRCQPREPA